MKRLRGPCPEATAQLLEAALDCDIARVRHLLETTSADINATDDARGGCTPLITACRHGARGEALANLLLDCGANVYMLNYSSQSAALVALEVAPIALCKRVLLCHGNMGIPGHSNAEIWRAVVRRDVTDVECKEMLDMLRECDSMYLDDVSLAEADAIISCAFDTRAWIFLRHAIGHPRTAPLFAGPGSIKLDSLISAMNKLAPIDVVCLLASKCAFPTEACIRVNLGWPLNYARQLLYGVPELTNRFVLDTSVWDVMNLRSFREPVAIMRLFALPPPTDIQIRSILKWSNHRTDRLLWALLRAGNYCATPIFNALAVSSCPRRWRLLAPELDAREPSARLHAAVCAGNVAAVELALAHGANPFWRNVHGHNAFYYATAVHAVLKEATQFRPELRVARWYGPYFQRRAWAFLLCCLRFEQRLGRDLRHYILRCLAALESV